MDKCIGKASIHLDTASIITRNIWFKNSPPLREHSLDDLLKGLVMPWVKLLLQVDTHDILSQFILPYRGLFSLGANFPKFHKWAHNSGKAILGCCVKFDCGLLMAEYSESVIFF